MNQPRYGPNGDAVRRCIARLAALDASGVKALAGTARRAGVDEERSTTRGRPASRPTTTRRCGSRRSWPPGTPRPRSRGTLTDAATTARAGRSAARLAHLLVLRHAFAPSTFASLTRPWRPRFLPDDRPAARVHRPGRGADRPRSAGPCAAPSAPVRCSCGGGMAGGDRGGRRARRGRGARGARSARDRRDPDDASGSGPMATRSTAVSDLRDQGRTARGRPSPRRAGSRRIRRCARARAS